MIILHLYRCNILNWGDLTWQKRVMLGAVEVALIVICLTATEDYTLQRSNVRDIIAR